MAAWDLAETLARSALYKLLSLAFLPPTDGIAQVFSGIDRIVRALPEGDRAMLAPAVADVATAGGGPSAAEHSRLFDVGLAATPYLTEYDPLASARKGHRLADLQGFYEAFGIRMAEHRKELPDHVAVELEFMSLLLLKAAHAAAEGLAEARAVAEEAAAAFLADHLGAWGPAFADRVEAATRESFYGFAARLLRGFLVAECGLLGLEMQPAGGAPAGEPGPPTCAFAPECAEPFFGADPPGRPPGAGCGGGDRRNDPTG